MRVRWQYVVLFVVLGWGLSSQIAYSIYAVNRYANRQYNLDLPFNHPYTSTVISHIPPRYRDSGLRRGDDVLALDGEPVMGRKTFENFPAHLHPGNTLTVTVRRKVNGEVRQMDVPVRMKPAQPESLELATLALVVVFPTLCLLVGFYIAFARPEDPVAWLAFAMLAAVGQIPAGGNSWALPSPWRESLFLYHPLLSNSWFLWLLLFALYFPTPKRFVKRLPWLPLALAALPAVSFAIDVCANFTLGEHMRENQWFTTLFGMIDKPLTLIFTAYIFAFFAALGHSRHTVPTNDARRRLRLMVNGCTFALLPLLPIALSQAGLVRRLPDWLQTSLLMLLPLFPLTMAYVIVVQRAMDVRMAVRSGVRYAIASNSIRVLRFVLVGALALITTSLARKSTHSVEAVLIAIAGVGLIFGLRDLGDRLNRWMDKRFFREAYNAEVILTDLSNSVANIREIPTLIQTVANRIADSLHVERVAVMLTRGECLQPVYQMGFDSVPPAPLCPSKRTLQTILSLGSVTRVYFDDPQSWVHGVAVPDQQALQRLTTQVLLPVSRKNRLLGLISLGPKRSEAPYSREDLQLLGALASQTAMALENAELTENVKQEAAARERLNRELEIAREVQQRLFPQKLPVIDGLDFAGYCRPALEVGGDYYDFIRLADNCLGIAIGDVSGKGIAAALMMASLQACLRGQTLNAPARLAQMIANINSLIYEASSANRYATFFYAQYDPTSRHLHYVNAGHNSPVLYRYQTETHEFMRLDAGGTVIGLFPSVPFNEAEVELQGGDILVAFTDGISEAMDINDGEYGEDRLLDTLRNCEPCSAEETVKRLLKNVDAFTAGAPQHDDMTLVVVRVMQ